MFHCTHNSITILPVEFDVKGEDILSKVGISAQGMSQEKSVNALTVEHSVKQWYISISRSNALIRLTYLGIKPNL